MGSISKRFGVVAAGVLAMASMSAAPLSAAPGTMSVTCIDWFVTAGHEDHIHAEYHVQDQNGKGVIGAAVSYENSYDEGLGAGPFTYQIATKTTTKTDGKNKSRGCAPGTGGPGTTGIACCIGAGKYAGEIPGKRACPSGYFTSVVTNVVAPEGSDLVWDGVTPPNGATFIASHD